MKTALLIFALFAVGCVSSHLRTPAQDGANATMLECGKDIVSTPTILESRFSWESGKFSGSIMDRQTGIAGVTFKVDSSQSSDFHQNFIRGAQTYGILGGPVGTKVPAELQKTVSDIFQVPRVNLANAKSITIYPVNVCDNIGVPVTFTRK